jgi:hypothetical protein
VTLPMLFNVRDGEAGLEKAVDELCDAGGQGRQGWRIDPDPERSRRGSDKAPIPSLLATAPCITISSAKAPARSAAWSSKPAKRAKPITSAC